MMLFARHMRTAASRACASSALLALALVASGCTQSTTVTTPSSTTTTPSAPIIETMTGVLPVGGTRFYSFSIASPGAVTATLQSMSGVDVPPTVIVNMGIGVPSGSNCSGSQSQVQASGDAGLSTQVSQSQDKGTFCVSISDIGNLPAPATFRIQIDHP